MAEKNPIRLNYDSNNNPDGFAEFQSADYIGLDDGGTGGSYSSLADLRIGLGLQIGSDVQAFDSDLSTLSNLTHTDGAFIVSDGTQWTVESGSTARDSLSLGTSDDVSFATLTTTGSVTIGGNLSVQGEFLNTSAEVIYVDDAFIKLNNGNGEVDSGIIIETSDTDDARLFYDVSANRWVAGENQSYDELLTQSSTDTLTNKSIDADNNTITNLEVDNLKSGVLDIDLTSVSASDDTIPSAKAVKTYVDSLDRDDDLSVTDGTNASTIDLDNDTLTIQGTSNEVEVVNSSGTFTVGLPTSITTNLVGDVTGTVSDVSNHDTDDISEGSTNLYFTNARSRSSVSVSDAGGDGSLSYDNTTGVFTYTGPSASEVRAHFSAGTGVSYSSGEFSIGQAVGTTDNVQFNNVQVDGTLTSDDITSTNISVAGNATITGNLTVQGTTTSVDSTTVTVNDPLFKYADGNSGNSVDIGFYGEYVQSSTTKYAGLVWDASQSDKFRLFHGVQTEPTSTLDITATGYTLGTLLANLEGDVTGNVTGNLTGDVTGTVSSLSNHDTDDLTEGATNLYYTTARWDTKMASADTDDLSEGSTNLYYTDTRVGTYLTTNSYATQSYVDSAVASENELSEMNDVTLTSSTTGDFLQYNGSVWVNIAPDTDDIAEGTNLYYTDTRADARISAASIADLSDVGFTSLASGDVLRYNGSSWINDPLNLGTDTVGDYVQNLVAGTGISVSVTSGEGQTPTVAVTMSSFDTDDLTEGATNLYYTDTRVGSYLTTNSYATQSYVDSAVANENEISEMNDVTLTSLASGEFLQYNGTAWVNVVPDTDDITEGTNLFYTQERVQDVVGGQFVTNGSHTGISFTYDDANDGAIDATVSLASFDTDDLSEGSSNLYYTDTRFDTRLATKTTDNLTEGSTNLYYTNARVESYLSGSTGIDFSSGAISIDSTVATLTGTQTLTNKTINFEDNTPIVEFAVTVADVSGNKYHLDGETSASIQLIPGLTYRFDQSDSSNSGHPLVFSTTQDGTHNSGSNYTTGVTTNGTPGSSGAYTQIVVDAATADTLYYYCSAHSGMGGSSVVSVQGTSLSASDTDDLAEGSSNLYYTDARARASVSVTDNGGDGSLSYNSSTGVITYTGPSASEVRAHFSAGTGITLSSGEISIGQAVGTSDNVTFNNMTVSGNLTVSGTTTTINTETLTVDDNIIVLNNNATGTPSENAGIEIERGDSTNVTLIWDETNDKWTVGSGTFVAGTFEGNLTGNVTGNVTGTVSSISNHDTDDLSEGATNLYYTDTRFDTRLSGKTTDNLTEGSTNLYYTSTRANTDFDTKLAAADTDDLSEGATNLYYTSTRANTDFDTRLATKSTTNLSEGTNLYHTTERVQDVVADQIVLNGSHTGISFSYDDANDGAIDATVSLSSFSTSDLSEGTNLYYTDARFDTRLGTKTTDNLTEGSTNLYYTDARADARIAAANVNDLNDVLFSDPTSSDDAKVISYSDSSGGFVLSSLAGLSGSGEVNTASNVNTAGIGVFKQKTGEDLEFRGINVGSAKLTITNDTANNEIDIDFGSVSIDDLSDVDTTSTAPTSGQALKWSGSAWIPGDASSQVANLTDVTLTSLASTNVLQYNGTAWVNVTLDTDDIGEGSSNLYYTTSRVNTDFDTRLATKTTDNLTEGSTNLYYTNARVDTEIDTYVTGGTGVSISSGEISIGQAVATTSDVTFNDLTVSGNLTVSGTTTTVNTETINLADNVILLNSNETGTPSQNGGIEIERGTETNKTLVWDESSDKWTVGSETFVAATFEGEATNLATSFTTGQTALSTAADDDVLVIYDTSATSYKKITKTDLVGSVSFDVNDELPLTLADNTSDPIQFTNVGTSATDLDLVLADGTSDPIQIVGTSNSATSFRDNDNDTKINLEETADEDTIHIYTAGTERATINSSSVAFTLPVQLPSFTTTERDALSSPQAGWTIFNSTTGKLNFYTGSAWEAITSS